LYQYAILLNNLDFVFFHSVNAFVTHVVKKFSISSLHFKSVLQQVLILYCTLVEKSVINLSINEMSLESIASARSSFHRYASAIYHLGSNSDKI
jgi:hypothetical protein